MLLGGAVEVAAGADDVAGAAAAEIMAGSVYGDVAGEESEGRGVEGGGAEVELGAELENIS